MSKAISAPSGTAPARSTPWIYNPWLDLIVGCGAWSAPLLLLTYFLVQADSRVWPLAFYFLALFFNYPHFMATVYRAYHTQTEFAKYRTFTLHVTLLLIVAGLAAHLWYPLMPWIFTLYICWSPWHYTGQNFGLLMMFARRAGISPTPGERRALHSAFAASYVLLVLSFHTGPSPDALIVSLGLPAKFTIPARGVLALFFVCSCGWALRQMARRTEWKTLLAPATLAATQFFWFLMPALIELASGREVPQTRYSSGILAVLHSTQYLWITSYYQRREARGEGKTEWKFSRYLLTLVAGGIALFIPGPWIVSRVFHVDFAASFLLFTALVNIHHFLLDGALWKLRDSRIAAMLLDAQGKTGDADGAMGSKMLGATKWLAGPARLATTLRIALVLLLLGWGLLDQRHFYLASRTNDRTALERAASWIPDDSAVQVRLASAERSNGKTDAELEALSKAAATAPANFAVQEEYARGLIETKHYADASTVYQKILAKNPKNARAWTNAGLLAARLGRGDEAVDDWQRAVDVDASQSNAQLYLAGALDQRGEIQAAARHYRAYLQIVAAHRDEHKAEGHQVIAALIKVADAATQQGAIGEALQGYKTAAAFGEKSGDKAMQSLALAHLAEAQDKSGDTKAAAASFQQALQLDAQLLDPQSRATDWFNYGEFLQRHQQEARLVYACYVQAENLLKNTPGEAQTAVSAERVQSETRIGRTAANEVRKRIEEELQQAISLSPSSFDRKH